VKLCVVSGVAPLCALIVKGKFPVAVDVPLNFAVPSWLSVKVRPDGNDPVSVRAGVGKPMAVIVKEPAVPRRKVVLFALVIAVAVADWKIAKGEREVTFPQTEWFAVSTVVVTSSQALPFE